ncbi:MAG: quinolinate synthase NadA [Planctomycetota bacterium]|nr:quinolinate synthase NadA [Planctomycetota bacterium]
MAGKKAKVIRESFLDERLFEKIKLLKAQRKAVILAHNYQPGEVQDLADFCGDSLGLSINAAQTDAKVIVFCGVKFMAQTAAILSPEKTVLLPDRFAGCPLADMITAQQIRRLKRKHPNALVVCYVNSPAEVKAESDYCCTSANAVEVVKSLPADRPIIFVPDQHLGRFVMDKTGRDLVLWPGYCPTHIVITEDDIKNAKEKFPDAPVLAHPECTEPVKELADQILSTGDRAVCPNMKKITLDKVVWSLEDMQYKITVPQEIRVKAKRSLDRMVEILPGE